MKKIFYSLIFLLFLQGCSSGTVFQPQIVERPIFIVPTTEPARQLPLHFYIITRDNMTAKIEEITRKTSGNNDFVIFALTTEGYQNLVSNSAELRRFIQQQRDIISAMREYYEQSSSNRISDDRRNNE